MRVLIVEGNPELGAIWRRHLQRNGCDVVQVQSQAEAIEALQTGPVDIIILDLVLEEGSALAVADFASYRHPDAKVIFVTDTTFFSDGSIFRHVPNACAMMPARTRPEDLEALVEHYAMH